MLGRYRKPEECLLQWPRTSRNISTYICGLYFYRLNTFSCNHMCLYFGFHKQHNGSVTDVKYPTSGYTFVRAAGWAAGGYYQLVLAAYAQLKLIVSKACRLEGKKTSQASDMGKHFNGSSARTLYKASKWKGEIFTLKAPTVSTMYIKVFGFYVNRKSLDEIIFPIYIIVQGPYIL